MPIFELGYRPWDGAPRPRLLRWWTITRTGITLGYRNRMLRVLLLLTLLPLCYYVPLVMAIGTVADPARPPNTMDGWFAMASGFLGLEIGTALDVSGAPVMPLAWSMVFTNFFIYVQIWTALIITMIVGPSVIAQDVRSKAFLVYFSKPLTRGEYILGKAGILVFFLSLVTILPSTLLAVIAIAFAPSTVGAGAMASMVGTALAASAIIIIPFTLTMMALSSMTKESRFAAFFWVGIAMIGAVVYQILSEAPGLRTSKLTFLTSIHEPVRVAIMALFDVKTQFQALGMTEIPHMIRNVTTTLPGGVALWTLVGLSVTSVVIVFRRVSAPMRI